MSAERQLPPGRDPEVDVESSDDLRELALEVKESGRALVLTFAGRRLAKIVPCDSEECAEGDEAEPASLEALLSLAGAWSDVDTEQMLRDIYEARDASTKPPKTI